jgi:YebC/PmpR family DNA-binding regulatory protein
MAGHSKFANIRHRKGLQDAKRGKIFTKLIREISVAAKMGGEDPANNPRLRDAIDKAFRNNMTRDTVERAIKRGVSGNDGKNTEEVTYEGYGPGGVAVLAHCLTDNRNRTVAEVRHAFSKCGGNLGTDGSVGYLFSHVGLFSFAPGSDEDKIMECALVNGAEDLSIQEDGSLELVVPFDCLKAVRDALSRENLQPKESEITLLPSTEVNLDQETAEKMLRLIDMLEDLDDVQNVYSNANIAEDILENL